MNWNIYIISFWRGMATWSYSEPGYIYILLGCLVWISVWFNDCEEIWIGWLEDLPSSSSKLSTVKCQFVSAKSWRRTQVAPNLSPRPLGATGGPSLVVRPGSLEASKLLMSATRGLTSDFWSDAAVGFTGEVLSREGEVQINTFNFADPIWTPIITIGPTIRPFEL